MVWNFQESDTLGPNLDNFLTFIVGKCVQQAIDFPVYATKSMLYLATVYTKGDWLDTPFAVAILGTKFLTTCFQSAKITQNSKIEPWSLKLK